MGERCAAGAFHADGLDLFPAEKKRWLDTEKKPARK